jgi:hypothetical protein
MPPTNRKRASAFDDFPANDVITPPQNESKPIPGRVNTQAQPVERIERLKPSQMLPDRYQPRRLLPSTLRQAFFSGQIDCYQAASEWLKLSKNDNGYRAEVERLLSMGGSFEDHGQIKPITGSWVPATNGRYIFLIETGERRFWAACLHKESNGISEEPQLRVEVVNKPTRQRQVLENRHAETPSSVGQACEVASLILAELGITPDPKTTDEYNYFRQARSQRMPAGLWERIMPVMQLTRPRMVQLLNILQMSTPLLELADRFRVPERVLREVLALPPEQWERMLRTSIQNEMTSEEVAELTSPEQPKAGPGQRRRSPSMPEPGRVAVSGLRRFANAITELDEISQAQVLDEVADTLIVTHQADGILTLLGELSNLVTARLDRSKR